MAKKNRRRRPASRPTRPGTATETRPADGRERPESASAGPARTASAKQARRAEARRQREALRRRAMRQRRARRVGIAALVAGAVVVVFLLLSQSGSSGMAKAPLHVNPNTLPGINKSPDPATWVAEESHLKQRLNDIGFAALSAEGVAEHQHDLLQVFVDDKAIVVPANIGINGFFSPVHTHDATGIIHIESPITRKFTLGEFFDVWGVRLTSTCIGGLCNGGGKTLQVFENGKAVSGNPRSISLTQHEDVVVTYGTPQELPQPIPSTYSTSISPTCAPDC